MLDLTITVTNGRATLTAQSDSQTVAPPPGPTVTIHHWAVYSSSSGLDVGSPFDTTDDITAETVFNTCISSPNGNAALVADSGFTVPPQTYDVNSGNHVLYSHGSTKFQPTDPLPTDGVGFDGSSIPTIGIFFEINGGGTRNAGIRHVGTTVQ